MVPHKPPSRILLLLPPDEHPQTILRRRQSIQQVGFRKDRSHHNMGGLHLFGFQHGYPYRLGSDDIYRRLGPDTGLGSFNGQRRQDFTGARNHPENILYPIDFCRSLPRKKIDLAFYADTVPGQPAGCDCGGRLAVESTECPICGHAHPNAAIYALMLTGSGIDHRHKAPKSGSAPTRRGQVLLLTRTALPTVTSLAPRPYTAPPMRARA